MIYLFDEDTTGWKIQTGEGLPVRYHDCTWDGNNGAYLCSNPFEAVYLIREAEETQMGITLTYERSGGFLPSYPVLEWEQETDKGPVGFSCYGWGSTRSFAGGMYNVVVGDLMIYGEYDGGGNLVSWSDLLHDVTFSADGRLLSGEEPDGYASPVVH